MTQRATAVLLLFLSVFLLSAVNASETRVISLVPSQTEMIYALGLENCMVGRSDYCNFPPEAQQKPSIGNMELNIEKIVSLRPTLLLDTNGMHQRYAPLFQQLGLRYVNMPTTSLQQVKEAAAKVAELLGNPKAGERFSEDWDARLRRIAPDQSEKRFQYILKYGTPRRRLLVTVALSARLFVRPAVETFMPARATTRW